MRTCCLCDLGSLCHHVLVNVKSACRIENDNIITIVFCVFYSVFRDFYSVFGIRLAVNIYFKLLT